MFYFPFIHILIIIIKNELLNIYLYNVIVYILFAIYLKKKKLTFIIYLYQFK